MPNWMVLGWFWDWKTMPNRMFLKVAVTIIHLAIHIRRSDSSDRLIFLDCAKISL